MSNEFLTLANLLSGDHYLHPDFGAHLRQVAEDCLLTAQETIFLMLSPIPAFVAESLELFAEWLDSLIDAMGMSGL